MASLTCPNCGQDNPDFLDDCQYCQTALRREATVSTGDNPTKKSTGELEKALPDWLQDARQQARDSAEEEAAKEAARSKPQKEEPVDLLAGLAFQGESDEEEVPDWLSAINPVQAPRGKTAEPPASPAGPAKDEGKPSDFFAQFEGSAAEGFDISPTVPLPGEAAHDESLPWLSGSSGSSAGEPQKEELADWFSQTTSGSSGSFTFDTPASGMDRFDTSGSRSPFESAPGQVEASPSGEPSGGSSGGPSGRASAPSEEPEDLGWLRDLEAASKGQPPGPAPSGEPEDAGTGWMSNLGIPGDTPEDLSWLDNLGGTPAPVSQPESQPEDLSWLSNLGGTPGMPLPETPSKEEDLGWLKDFGATSAPAAPAVPSSGPQPSQPAPAEEDLSWLDALGGTTSPTTEPSSGPAQDDLSWLKEFGAAPVPGTPLEAASPTSASQEDLGWLKDLTGTPAETPASAEDLGWLKDFGGTPSSPAGPASVAPSASAEPSSGPSQEAPDWLKDLSATSAAPAPAPSPFAETDVPDWLKDMEAGQSLGPVPPFSPARTAPLSAEAAQQIPDWLRSATEAAKSASLPPLSAAGRDRSAEKRFEEAPKQPVAESPQGVPVDESIFSTSADTTLSQKALDNQDVDALFAVDMPDWLTQTGSPGETSAMQEEALPARVGDELARVELPSWVQAMRPVEAVMDEASAVSTDQTTEREGPLAGLRGVIPFAPIGSAQRPRAISLKLQATAEQQAGATLMEQIIAGEAAAQPLKTSAFISSQHALRWGLAILFWVVLSVIIGLGTQIMPISSALPVEVGNISSAIFSLPSNAPMLVVVDYEPSLAGEMEATSGPVLDQLVVLRKPVLTFVSSSPNGVGLVDRLLANTKISQPAAEGGLDYQAGTHYFNVGYLPGGLAGVRGFTEAPQSILPEVGVSRFSEFAAVILITDQAEAGQIWIEQLTLAKQIGLQTDPALAGQHVYVVASGQAGPMLRPYVSSGQVTGMVSGLPEAARLEYVNSTRPGIARTYWDAFGVGLFLAIISIIIGSLWSLFAGIRARRADAEPG